MRFFWTSWLSEEGWREMEPVLLVTVLVLRLRVRRWLNCLTRGPREGTAVVIMMMFISTVEAWK